MNLQTIKRRLYTTYTLGVIGVGCYVRSTDTSGPGHFGTGAEVSGHWCRSVRDTSALVYEK